MDEGDEAPRDGAQEARGAGRQDGGGAADGGRGRVRAGRSLGVALATLSTVIGLATGVVTLRDEIFPGAGEGAADEEQAAAIGGAQEPGAAGYADAVGAVCDAVNDDDEARADQARETDRRLRAATTFGAQRDALVDGNDAATTRTSATLARFAQLTPPPQRRTLYQQAQQRWQRTVERLRDEGTAFAQAAAAADLRQALAQLGDATPGAEADRRAWRTALATLGGDACRLEPPVDPARLTLP